MVNEAKHEAKHETKNGEYTEYIESFPVGYTIDQDTQKAIVNSILPLRTPLCTDDLIVNETNQMNQKLYGFDIQKLEEVAEALLKDYDKTINVGNVTGEGDDHIETATAFAARFIKEVLVESGTKYRPK